MLTNYLIGKVVGADGKVTYPEYLYLKLYQGYDFSPDFSYSSGSHLSDFMAEARSTPFTWLSGTMDLQYNLRYNRLDVFNAGVGFSDKRGDHLSVNYLTTRDQVGAIDTQLTIRIIKPLDFYFDYRYDLLDKVPIQTTYGLDYRRQCWEVSLRVYDNSSYSELVNGVLTPQPKEWKFQVLFTLTGLGQYRF
jgi:lipopolysaccharide assembly outer membrane protein LptD (OstA)